MATFTPGQVLSTTTNTAGPFNFSAFTPAVGDVIIAFICQDGSTAGVASLVDNQGGTYTQICTGLKQASADRMYAYVRDQLVASAVSHTLTVTFTGAGTGALGFVGRVAGLTRIGIDAVRQFDLQENQPATTTPGFAFGVAVDTNNPTILCVFNATNPATLTAPTNWTERGDQGHATPAKGAQYCSRDSGFSGTGAITYGAASGTVWGGIGLEMDTSAAAAVGALVIPRRDRRIVPLI